MKGENVIETQIDPVKAALHQDQVDDPLRGGKHHQGQVDDPLRDGDHHQGQVRDRPERSEAERFLEFHPSAPPYRPGVATQVNLNLTINLQSIVAVLSTVFISIRKKQDILKICLFNGHHFHTRKPSTI